MRSNHSARAGTEAAAPRRHQTRSAASMPMISHGA